MRRFPAPGLSPIAEVSPAVERQHAGCYGNRSGRYLGPSMLPRPSPAGSLVEGPSGPSRSMSPYSPQAAGSRIPRLFRSPGLNVSFTLPSRTSITLSPRPRRAPVGVPTPPYMPTTPPNILNVEPLERDDLPPESTPTGRPPQDRRELTGTQLVGGCAEDEEDDGEGEEDEGPNTSYESYHTALDTSAEDEEYELATPLATPQKSKRRTWNQPEEDQPRFTAGCLPTWGQSVKTMSQAKNTLPAWARKAANEQQEVSQRSPTPSPPREPENTPCLDRLQRLGISCTDGDGGACAMPRQNVQPEDEGMNEMYENASDWTQSSLPEDDGGFDEQVDYGDYGGDSVLDRTFTIDDGDGLYSEMGYGDGMDQTFIGDGMDQQLPEEEDDGIYKYGLQPGESMEAYEKRHQALIDRFTFPTPKLKPMQGCRVDPLPGETPQEFLRRNRQAEEEWAAIAPPDMYTSGRKPGETWEEWEGRYHDLLERGSAFAMRERELLFDPGSDAPDNPWNVYGMGAEEGESIEERDARISQKMREMYLKSKQSEARLAEQIAMGMPGLSPSGPYDPSEEGACALPSSSGAYAPSTSGGYSPSVASTSGGYAPSVASTSGGYAPSVASTSGGYAPSVASTSRGCEGGACALPPRTPRSPPRKGDNNLRRQAIENSRRAAGVRQHGRTTNEDFFGLSYGTVDDDCAAPPPPPPPPPPSESGRSARSTHSKAPSRSPVGEAAQPRSETLATRKSPTKRSPPKRRPVRNTECTPCQRDSVANLIHGPR